MSLMKNSTMRQKARLLVTLASLNNGHSSNLRAYCVGVRSSFKPNLVPIKPFRPRNVAWWSLLVTNLNNTTPGRASAAGAKAHAVVSHYHVTTTTLAHNLIWPCNNSFSVSLSLALKPMKHKLRLRSSHQLGSPQTRLTT
jgi:hypothetical protein